MCGPAAVWFSNVCFSQQRGLVNNSIPGALVLLSFHLLFVDRPLWIKPLGTENEFVLRKLM